MLFCHRRKLLDSIKPHLCVLMETKPELRAFWGDSLTKPHFGLASADVAIIFPGMSIF